MEDFLKVLHLWCLLSVTAGLEFKPSLNINTPIDFSINKVTNTGSDKSTSTRRLNRECYCIPRTANSIPVINYLNPENENDIKRLVVFLYKTGEGLKAYIPNKRKQEMIPDPYFDENEGDLFKPISSQFIVEFIENNPDIIKLQNSAAQHIEEVNSNESEVTQVVSNKPQLQNDMVEKPEGDYFSGNQLYDFTSNSEQLSSDENNEYFNEEDIAIDVTMTPTINGEEQQVDINIIKPELNGVINSGDTENFQDISSIFPNNLEENSPSVINNPKEHHKEHHIPPMVLPISQENNIKEFEWNEIPNVESKPSEQPLESYQESPDHQNPHPINPNVNQYPTFYEWFEDQLTRVVLYNLGTPSKILALRDRIKKILIDNGMHLGVKGDVTDSNGELVQMNTIKIRPILIGDQVEYQTLLNEQANLKDSVVAYTQLIEITIGMPPRLLGTLMMGTVFLPRNLSTTHVKVWGNHIAHTKQDGHPHLLGCITCKTNYPYSFTPLNRLHYKHIVPHKAGSYLGRPVRIGLSNDNYIVMRKKLTGNQLGVQPAKKISNIAGRSGIGDIFGGLLNLLPNRRLLGGIDKNVPKIPNSYYPNDVLPGFRIIGGNAATSSGTPLVSKGRSGFKKSSFII